ncbi:4-hydroxy-2-oxoheptanedioate aldolase [Carnimonas bestiolae]|uniref:4-hydroxy-2-oxoheptanedioate aldolase n=1 Tax=Carnimonas bestiolae TaxID=3402172 RepID=UPI003EDC4218
MPAPINPFKQALRSSSPQIGLWLALANAYSAEISAAAGYDWLLLDAEHAPNDLPLLLGQLQAVQASASHAVVRPPVGEAWMIKQLLDIGAQTLLIPMVESAAQAEQLVRAVRYPPHGIRGVGAALARASRFNAIDDYLSTANEQVCLLVQIESRAGLDALDDIAAVEGVDGVFIGPADLAADLGFIGRPSAPEVQQVVVDALTRLGEVGKPAGILTSDLTLAQHYLTLGAAFVAVGSDIGLFTAALSKRLSEFRQRHAIDR